MTCEQCYHCDVCWHRMTIYGPYALMGMSHGNMEVWCANCKPKAQIIEVSKQIRFMMNWQGTARKEHMMRSNKKYGNNQRALVE